MPPPKSRALLRRDGAERSPLRCETQRGAAKARVEATRAAEGIRRGAGRTVLRVEATRGLGCLPGCWLTRGGGRDDLSSAIGEETSREVEAGC